jgi:hypothetical protein
MADFTTARYSLDRRLGRNKNTVHEKETYVSGHLIAK